MVQDFWEPGLDFQRLKAAQEQLQARRTELERRKKNIQAELRKRRGRASRPSTSPLPSASAASTPDGQDPVAAFTWLEAEETSKVQLNWLKREEAKLAEESKRLDASRAVLLREIKRIRDEDSTLLTHMNTHQQTHCD